MFLGCIKHSETGFWKFCLINCDDCEIFPTVPQLCFHLHESIMYMQQYLRFPACPNNAAHSNVAAAIHQEMEPWETI